MATSLSATRTRFFDKCGKPLIGGKVYTYQVGTTTLKTTYTDSAKTTQNKNPILLDSVGSADIYLDGAYRVRVLDRNGVLVEDIEFTESWYGESNQVELNQQIEQFKATTDQAIDAYKGETDQKLVEQQTYVDEQLSTKAPQATTYTKTEVDSALSLKAPQSNTYTKAEVDTTFAAYVGGRKAYTTLALAQAAQSSLPANTAIEVTNDPDPAKNGTYQWNGTTLTKSDYDPLTQAKSYTDYTVVETIALKKSDDPSIICIVSDAEGNALVWIEKSTGIFKAAGLLQDIFSKIYQIKTHDDPDVIPLSIDSAGNVMAGFYKSNGKFFAAGLDSVGSSVQTKAYKYFAQKPLTLEINHVLSYGQSLSMGATATAVLSTTQPYANLTFNTGPRKDTEATSVISLVEQFNNPSIDGYANRGETHCSGLANYASRAMMLENGINPQDHVIFASTAGHGGYTIDQLKKGAAWYSVLIDQVNKAKELNIGKTYHVPVVPWIQGENNAVSGGLQTPYAEYKAKLVQLQTDVDADVKAITSQVNPVRFITYQMSYAARTWPDIAKAQLDLARENDNFMLATPMYHFPYAGDNVHLTNVGYKWMGAYFGRAYKQYMIEGRKPDFIDPLSAQIVGNQIIIKFDVPTLPLRIDTTTLASTTNAGFKVTSGMSEIAITSVIASDDTVILQLASAPTGNVQVRYALDYLGAGLTITGGASGNLRDSTSDSIEIAGVEKPLYHVCPHFELTAFLDKGI
ncbi:sialate O-acetylesterase [Acinetobacter indicus]|uniref:sialate O-acetylesterase n=1 Tax=Acinetobacter indicus TaxID=756892 RepID=UPI000CEC4D75|nr:sialate O-acetylesterase [Acinetobacter indicus]